MAFKDKLKRLMGQDGLTQQKLAEVLHVTHMSVGNWLSGALPRPSTRKALADYFKIPPEILFDDTRSFPENTSSQKAEEAQSIPKHKVDEAQMTIGFTRKQFADICRAAGSKGQSPHEWAEEQLLKITTLDIEELAEQLKKVIAEQDRDDKHPERAGDYSV